MIIEIVESAKQQYRELLALTQLYLLQEHRLDQRIFSESSSYAYFKELALQRRQQKAPVGAAITPKKITPPLVKPITPPAPPPAPPLPKEIVTPKPIAAAPPPPPQAPTPKVEAPPPPKHQPTPPASSFFELQPMAAPIPQDLSEIRNLIQKEFPQLALLEQPPSDAIAKQQMSQWKLDNEPPAVMILTFNETDKPLELLKNIAKAIQLTIGTVKLISAEAIEREKGWVSLQSPELRLVITSDYGIYSLTELMKHYKEDARRNRRFLDAVPLLLLPDLSVYMKEPLLKPSPSALHSARR